MLTSVLPGDTSDSRNSSLKRDGDIAVASVPPSVDQFITLSSPKPLDEIQPKGLVHEGA